jgi:hypothetical protein
MNIIVGIVIGILIVFNWSSIKNYFDGSLAKQGVEVNEKSSSSKPSQEKVDGGASLNTAPAQDSTKPKDLNATTEQRLKDIVLGK